MTFMQLPGVIKYKFQTMIIDMYRLDYFMLCQRGRKQIAKRVKGDKQQKH